MAIANHERVGKSLELLNTGLYPFVEREMKAAHGEGWRDVVAQSFRDEKRPAKKKGQGVHWDTQTLLHVLWDQWNPVFGKVLGQAERSLVSELRDTRNRWAHQEAFSTDDAYRALDSMHRLLTAVSAEESTQVDQQKQELLRVRFDEQARQEKRKMAGIAIEVGTTGGLKPWREVITPHHDVHSGKYQQAEFAADLGQVQRGEGSDEYRHPTQFFSRTFLTEGLKHLLTDALLRLTGKGGDPVVELQTNFGGGKSHAMIAIYHLFSGTKASELPGVEDILEQAGEKTLPTAQRPVLVGTALSPGQAHKKPDGTVVNTLWGEMAWQLGGKQGYKLVADADKHGVSPGSDVLRALFKDSAPCVVLIDEWVAYVRQLYGKVGLSGGSFEANLSFAQALTEAVKAVPRCLLVASLPASNIEIGGEVGQEALTHLKNVFARIESPWRPATAEEGFEIVRRRLFEPLTDPKLCTARDAVADAFSELYQRQAQEFPSFAREGDYLRRIKAAYPIHPELFDRLYNDWSALDKFQRTRGVLRLMAAVIHTLWEREDRSLLILPSMVPIDAHEVQFELTRYLDEPWVPVIERDVDGPSSLPLRLDRDNPNLGRYSACRRVARATYLGSAPTFDNANRGLEDTSIKLGSVQPGEIVPTFSDALRRLTDQATHLYVDNRRYWYSTQPSVNRLAQDRAAQRKEDDVEVEVKGRLQGTARTRGDFAGVHPCPSGSANVPDERETRLIVLGPEFPHVSKDPESAARVEAAKILENRGNTPRQYRNTLVFLAPDRNRLAELNQGVRLYLAWKSIQEETESLNLDGHNRRQAATKLKNANEDVERRIPETYCWLLVPYVATPTGTMEWHEIRLQGAEDLVARASKKLKNEELLISLLGGVRLRQELDRIPLWQGDHIEIRQLLDHFSQYLYLPRLKDEGVLMKAVEDGMQCITWQTDSFGYAEAWDERSIRYRGLKCGQAINPAPSGLLVKPEVAAKQLSEESPPPKDGPAPPLPPGETIPDGSPVASPKVPPAPPRPKRYHGTKKLDPSRVGRDAGRIAEEVIQHMVLLPGAKVEVTLEIRVDAPEGVPDQVTRTVSENSRTLKFENFGFEED